MAELKVDSAGPDNERQWSRSCLLAELGISARAFKQMRELGAVDAAVKRGKGAMYHDRHLRQARELLAVQEEHRCSMPAAAEYIRLRAAGLAAHMSKTSTVRQAVDACLHGRVKHLGQHVFIAVDSGSRTGLQAELFKELVRCATLFFSVRNSVYKKMKPSPASSIFPTAK